MDITLIAEIATVALAVLSVFAGNKLLKFKDKLKQVSNLVAALSTALEDEEVTVEELQKIVDQFKELLK